MNVSDFLTMRYTWPSFITNTENSYGLPGKAMVNLAALNGENYNGTLHFREGNHNPHRPFLDLCPKNSIYQKLKRSPFIVNHYSGSYEQFSFRNDVRNGTKSLERYNAKAWTNISDTQDISATPWLIEFVETVGSARAQYLLKGVGQLVAT